MLCQSVLTENLCHSHSPQHQPGLGRVLDVPQSLSLVPDKPVSAFSEIGIQYLSLPRGKVPVIANPEVGPGFRENHILVPAGDL